MTRFWNLLKAKPGLAVLLVACHLLPLGIWGPGLWDPWEMNRAFVARRMAVAPVVLVAESRPQTDPTSLSAGLASALADDASVVSTADPGTTGAPLDAARGMLADHVYRVAVIDLDAKVQKPDDDAGIRSVADTLKAAVPQNSSTSFLLVSGGGALDAAAIRATVLERLDAEAAEAAEGLVTAVPSRAALADAVTDGLGGDAFLAQFKSGGRTVFVPPLGPWLLSLSFRAFGQSEAAARLPGVLLAILCLVLVYRVAGRTFGQTVAALAVVGLATAPLFFESARFVANEQGHILWLALGSVAFGAIASGRHAGWAPLAILLASTVLLWLDQGLTGAVTIAAIVVAFPVVTWEWKRPVAIAAAAVGGLALVLAALTFLPDAAFFRQFRFTAATFAGGMRLEARSFDFALKEVGFGLFPWSALLPLSVMAAVGTGERPKPERLVLLLWGLAPLVVLMVELRPMFHTLYAGVPALALLNALYLAEVEDDGVQSRLLAFFGFGFLVVVLKDVMQSPAPLVSFLTTDPMFSEPGKGDIVFPPVSLHAAGKAFALLAGAALVVGGGRLVSLAARFPQALAGRRTFLIVLFAAIGLVVLDILIFVGLKWNIISGGAGPDAAVGPVLVRIFLTGPDIVALYLLVLAVVAARHASRVRGLAERVVGAGCLEGLGRALLRLERPVATRTGAAIGAAGLAVTLAFGLFPELSYHLSQKHIIETYQESAEKLPGDLYRHGSFAVRGSEDSNFYTGQVKEMTSRQEVIERLKDPARRTFFVMPKNQWSEINSAFRAAAGGRFPPVLDDRSSRFVLAASSLAPGEEDHNWLAAATLTQERFDALPDVTRELVNFDDKVHLVGYSLDAPAVRRGGKITLKTFFKAVDKVPVSYRLFMHIDRQGSSSRIHGDHWILNLVKETEEQTSCVGCFATTHWLKGDIVVDSYEVEVPIGSPSGPHDIWMGFYNPSDDKRLVVKDFDKAKVRHDGQNRVRIGVLTVE
jgi:hypothetical protein